MQSMFTKMVPVRKKELCSIGNLEPSECSGGLTVLERDRQGVKKKQRRVEAS